jgi:hypothetical protein
MATNERTTRREQREQRREAERLKRESAAKQGKTNRYLIGGVIGALVLIGLLLAAGPIASSITASAAQGQQQTDAGRDHIGTGQAHGAYTSNPPASGAHYADAPRWGSYDQPLPDELLIHGLEHGGIVIGYNCAEACPELAAQLKALVSEYPAKVVLAPRPNKDNPYRITATAWRWLDGFNDFDAARIRAFIAAHKDKGPELVPDM